jgi:hypothetical protein
MNFNQKRIKPAIQPGWRILLRRDDGIINYNPIQNHGLSFGRDLLLIQTYFARVCCESFFDCCFSFLLYWEKTCHQCFGRPVPDLIICTIDQT